MPTVTCKHCRGPVATVFGQDGQFTAYYALHEAYLSRAATLTAADGEMYCTGSLSRVFTKR